MNSLHQRKTHSLGLGASIGNWEVTITVGKNVMRTDQISDESRYSIEISTGIKQTTSNTEICCVVYKITQCHVLDVSLV